jgi:penicillin-binding protein 1A
MGGNIKAIASLGTSGGASALTQQLAKQLFTVKDLSFLPFKNCTKSQGGSSL